MYFSVLCCNYIHYNTTMKAAVTKSRYWLLPTGWLSEESELDSPLIQEFSLPHIVQASSEVHQSSYLMGMRAPFPGGKAAGACS
jgi:hypothetical protein